MYARDDLTLFLSEGVLIVTASHHDAAWLGKKTGGVTSQSDGLHCYRGIKHHRLKTVVSETVDGCASFFRSTEGEASFLA